MTNRIPGALLSAAVATLLSGGTAMAQSGGESRGEQAGVQVDLGEIVVTARRREERLQDVPIAINAVGGEDLAKRGVLHTEELRGFIPNVQISSFVGGATTPNITLRGIGVGNEFNATAASPVGVYIDEDYQGFRPAHGQQLFDMERLEVIKGPQGTLYGRNTTGGAINFISRIPQLGETNGHITGRYGNYDARTIDGALEFTVVPEVLGVRFAGNYAKADGWIKNRVSEVNLAQPPGYSGGAINPADLNVTQKDYAATDSRAARVTVRFKPNDGMDFVLKGYWAKSDPIGMPPLMRRIGTTNEDAADASGYNRAGLGFFESQANTVGTFLNKTKGLTLRSQFDFGKASVVSITGYNKSFYDADTDCDGGINEICNNQFQSDAEQFNEDLRVNLDLGRLNLIAGVYYGWQNIDTNNGVNYFGFIDDTYDRMGIGGLIFNPPIGTPEAIAGGLFNPAAYPVISGIYARQHFVQVSRSKAIYSEGTYALTDALALTVGARYTKDTVKYKDALTQITDAAGTVRASVIPFSFPYDPNITPFSAGRGSKQFTGRGILDYKFTEEAHAFFSYSKGYRAGTFNGFAYQSSDQIYFVKPEKIDAFELGVKSRVMGGRMQLNASAFHYKYKNQQLQEIVGSIGFLRALDGRVQGLELEAIAQATPDLRLSASVGMLDTKYKRNAKSVIGGEEVGGNKWPFAPALTFNANADWTFARLDGGSFSIVPEAQYASKYYYEVTNKSFLRQKGYWIVNGRLGYESDAGYSVSLWGKNLFNEKYAPWGANTVDFGVNYYIRAIGRTYGVEASYRF